MYAWGDNSQGQLGLPFVPPPRREITAVPTCDTATLTTRASSSEPGGVGWEGLGWSGVGGDGDPLALYIPNPIPNPNSNPKLNPNP